MARYVAIHPQDPQPRLLARAADEVRAGGLLVIPTDCCYALACRLGDKDAVERIRHIRAVDERHHLTLHQLESRVHRATALAVRVLEYVHFQPPAFMAVSASGVASTVSVPLVAAFAVVCW